MPSVRDQPRAGEIHKPNVVRRGIVHQVRDQVMDSRIRSIILFIRKIGVAEQRMRIICLAAKTVALLLADKKPGIGLRDLI